MNGVEVLEAAPARLYPSRGRLVVALDKYKRAVTDLEEYRRRAAKAEALGQSAINDGQQTEEEAAAALGLAQVWQTRVKNREMEQARCLGELEVAAGAAATELDALVRGVWMRTRARIVTEVLAVLKVDPDTFNEEGLFDVLEGDLRLSRIRGLGVGQFSARQVVEYSQDPVTKYTTGDGVIDVTTDRNIRSSTRNDVNYTIQFSERVLDNFEKVLEMEKELKEL
jgi:hypothetical protein